MSDDDTGGIFDVTDHHLTVNGERIRFTAFKANETRLLINAPGVMQFSAVSLDDARDTLRGLYDRRAVQ